ARQTLEQKRYFLRTKVCFGTICKILQSFSAAQRTVMNWLTICLATNLQSRPTIVPSQVNFKKSTRSVFLFKIRSSKKILD
ncbi:hypothetical protein, partial [Pseudomonas aeruginosa]|uniref:hypothetical protein n=1 Tax=Pseudomonas aeruginosa TaxID=287 RepID=UPI00397B76A4